MKIISFSFFHEINDHFLSIFFSKFSIFQYAEVRPGSDIESTWIAEGYLYIQCQTVFGHY